MILQYGQKTGGHVYSRSIWPNPTLNADARKNGARRLAQR